MTNEEAIKELKERYLGMSAYADREQFQKANQALDMAIKSLEKQIPRKPIINNRKIQCINGHNQPTQHYKYCPMCGQLMDWSDTK